MCNEERVCIYHGLSISMVLKKWGSDAWPIHFSLLSDCRFDDDFLIICMSFWTGHLFLKLRYCDLGGIDVYALLHCRRDNCDHFPIVYTLFYVIRFSKVFCHQRWRLDVLLLCSKFFPNSSIASMFFFCYENILAHGHWITSCWLLSVEVKMSWYRGT